MGPKGTNELKAYPVAAVSEADLAPTSSPSEELFAIRRYLLDVGSILDVFLNRFCDSLISYM